MKQVNRQMHRAQTPITMLATAEGKIFATTHNMLRI